MRDGTQAPELSVWLPQELADELIEAGLARPAVTTRGNVDLLVNCVGAMSVAISFAQLPATVEDLIRRVKQWRHGQTKPVTVTVRTGAGLEGITVELEADTPVGELERLLAHLRPQPAPSPAETDGSPPPAS